MRSVRIWFEKKGMIRYISHLDLMRTISRALTRAALPVWYTEGFNPHAYLAFGLPLSLGMESEGDFFDIRLTEDISNEQVYLRLKAAMPPGLTVTEAADPVLDPKFISFARFKISFYPALGEDGAERARRLLDSESLIVEKLSKQGRRKVIKQIDAAGMIREKQVVLNNGATEVLLCLPAGSASNLNPALIAERIKSETGAQGFLILRRQLLDGEMKNFR